MVLGCTLFAGAAQILMKFGAIQPMPAIDPARPATIAAFIVALVGNLPLVAGYGCHAGNALLLILALRDGELSVLYPILSLSYVWVIGLSMYFFHDQLNAWKIAGVLLVISGVAFLGRVSSRG